MCVIKPNRIVQHSWASKLWHSPSRFLQLEIIGKLSKSLLDDSNCPVLCLGVVCMFIKLPYGHNSECDLLRLEKLVHLK